MAILHSRRIDTSKVPAYFSYLPVKLHAEVALIEESTRRAIEHCSKPKSKERAQALYRHSNPYGNAYALCHPQCEINKLKLFVEVVEMIWIDDDVTEELPHADAIYEHDILRQGLHPQYDSNMNCGKTVGVKKQFLRECRDRMLDIDKRDTPSLLMTLDTYLQEYDSSEKDFDTMEEYLPYRIPNAGFRVCCHFTRWAMNIHLTEDEMRRVRKFEWTLGGVLALTNDYFSWNKEKYQDTDRVRNAVRVLMKQYSLDQQPARMMLKGMIVDEEEKAKRLRMEIESQPMSRDLRRYVEALELYVGGNCYWSATCPRYNRPQEEQTFTF